MIGIGKVDIGKKRSRNEDCVFVSNASVGILPNLYIVADGMGGHKSGSIASKLAIDAFCAYMDAHKKVKLTKEEDVLMLLKRGIQHANFVVYKKAKEDEQYSGMGTTMTLCTIINQVAYIAHVGDTRFYTLNKETITQVTTDHSLVQEMHEKGYLSRQDMDDHPQRHVITRAVGTYEQVKVDTLKHELTNVEYILLCSDGLTTMVDDEKIHQVVYKKTTIKQVLNELIGCANQEGGMDNIAVIIAKQGEVSI